METKKSNRILKVISAILSLVITIICILVYRNKLQDFLYIPKALFSTAILILMFSIVLYLYLYFILKKIANKKIVIPIILILILVLIVAGVFFIKNNINYILRNIILMLIFIIGVVCLPLIVLGAVIIGDSKYKKILVCIVLIITVYTYVANLSEVMSYAENIIVDFSSYSMKELFTLRQEEKKDRSYLENYNQKYVRDGYLDKYDIKQIIEISDSKSEKITINYKDELSNINLKVSNKNDNEIHNLLDSLESEYYKFNYEINEEVVINIERYIIDKKQNKEKNEDIVLKGTIRKDLVKSEKTYENDTGYFIMRNKMISNETVQNKELEKFKILLAYDEETKDLVPVVDDIKEYSYIDSYVITSEYISIQLKEGITLKNTDYTLRINRYDENFKIDDHNNYYYYNYDYDPVVSQGETTIGTVIEMKFLNSYTTKNIRNIEIIFGEN